ncbi:MAG: tRNA (adenosine(37)-N6)-dimethylallyltransferase MiaA [Acidobacteriaceae bacterium]
MTRPGESLYPLLVVAGPTASGKTALALRLAEALGGEIISCDSVAVYRLMEIGSAKPSCEERRRVAHHCMDLYWPDEVCTAGDYARHAREAVAGIRERGRIPIVAGGTGLYLRAFLEGLAPSPRRDDALRERLRARVERRGAASLHRLLERLDPRAATLIHANDVPKVIRSIEVTLAARRPQTEQWKLGRDPLRGYRVLQMGLAPLSSREIRERLYARINHRAAEMFERGLPQETEMLRERYGEGCRCLGALGYAQAMAVLRGEMTLDAAVAQAQQGHRNYAKRQGTWFRSAREMHWLPGFGDEKPVQEEALALAHDIVAGGADDGSGWAGTGGEL